MSDLFGKIFGGKDKDKDKDKDKSSSKDAKVTGAGSQQATSANQNAAGNSKAYDFCE
jgi:hypothetical protein